MEIKLKPVMDFGKMPIANAFLTKEQFQGEYFYNMVLGYDPKTKAIGLVNRVPPEKMFHENYAYFSSTSKGMQIHFKQTAEKLLPFAKKGIVVEVGSNDGIMLEAWKNLGVRAIGIEPSANVAAVSRANIFIIWFWGMIRKPRLSDWLIKSLRKKCSMKITLIFLQLPRACRFTSSRPRKNYCLLLKRGL